MSDDPNFFRDRNAGNVEREEFSRRHDDANGNGSAHKNQHRFRLERFAEIQIGHRARYIIHRVLPAGGLIVVWGPPKCGKSYFVSDLALHIALEWPYRGRRVEPGAVVYVAAEGQSGMSDRIAAFRKRKLSDPEANPPFFLLPTRLDLVHDLETLIAEIQMQLAGTGIVLIVLDTLNRSLAGSESKDEDMSAYVQACDRLRETFSCAVLIVHHCGTNEHRPRGHTSLTGAADAQIEVKRDTAGNIIATIEFMKDGPEGDQIVSRLEPVDVGIDENGNVISSCVVVPVDDATVTTKGAKGPRLSPANRRALDLLKDAITRGGEVPPADNHIPNNTPCVTETVWRETCYLGAVSDSEKPDAKKKAFQRAAQALVGSHVGKWGQWVWPI